MATPTDTKGWLKLYRSVLSSDRKKRYKYCPGLCWIDLLLAASRCNKTVWTNSRKVVLERGEVAISLEDLKHRWRLGSKSTVMRRLRDMENDGRIVIKHSHLINVIQIVNYNRYQGVLSTNQESQERNTAYEKKWTTDWTTDYEDSENGNAYYPTLPYLFENENIEMQDAIQDEIQENCITASENGTENTLVTDSEIAECEPLLEPTPINIFNNSSITTHSRIRANETSFSEFEEKNFKEKSEEIPNENFSQKLQEEKFSYGTHLNFCDL